MYIYPALPVSVHSATPNEPRYGSRLGARLENRKNKKTKNKNVHSAGSPPNELRPFGRILGHSANDYVHSASNYVHSASDLRSFGAILVHSATKTFIRRTTFIQRRTSLFLGFLQYLPQFIRRSCVMESLVKHKLAKKRIQQYSFRQSRLIYKALYKATLQI